MITKRVNRITYAWSENALNGKGWWFELGKNGGLGLAATRAIGGKLGRPKPGDYPPKNASKYYYTTTKSGKPIRKRFKTAPLGDDGGPSQYEQADITASKSLSRIASERMMAGEGLGASLKGAFKEKISARATNLKKKFDPLNMLSKISPLAATAYGMKRGRSASDISYFTGIQAQAPDKPQEQEEETSAPRKRERQTATKAGGTRGGGVDRGANATLKQIYKLISDKFEDDKKLREIDKNFEEEKKQEEDRKHKELLAALKGKGKDKKEPKKEEKKNTLMDMLMGALGFLRNLPSLLMNGLSKLFGGLKNIGSFAGKAVKGVFNAGKSIVKGGWNMAKKAGSMVKSGVKSVMGFGSKAVTKVGEVAGKGLEAAEKAGATVAKTASTATKVATGAGSKLLKGGSKLLGFLKSIPGLSLLASGADLIMRVGEVNEKKKNGLISDAEYKKEIVKAIGSAAAAGLLPVLGGAIGSVVPGVGTVIGGLGGAAAALLGGDKIGGWLAGKMYDFFVDDKKGTASEVKKDSASPVPSSASPSDGSTSLPGSPPVPTTKTTPTASPENIGSPALTSRMNQAVATNQSLVGPSATVGSSGGNVIQNSTTIVGGQGGGGSQGTPMGMRNEEPVLMRVQYGNVRPV